MWVQQAVGVVFIALATLSGVHSAVAPNHFLGTCLTDHWVKSTEETLKLNHHARDHEWRRVHPFLRAARRRVLYQVNDSRTHGSEAFGKCKEKAGSTVYGVGATVNPSDGSVLDQGQVNGSLVVELSGWPTQSLTSTVFAIITQEVYGIPVSFFSGSDDLMTERMAPVGEGLCTPTHVNLEVWITGVKPSLLAHASESYIAGDVGYVGRSGLYTTKQFVHDSMNTTLHPNPLYADFWKGYKMNEDLIAEIPATVLTNNSQFFPPAKLRCANDTMGCINHCSKSAACTEREDQGKECMVVAMMVPSYDPGFLQAVMSNIGIPTYFCFIGYYSVQAFAVHAAENHVPALFYHYEPDPFHIEYPDMFERVFLPRSIPERVALATGSFGENGYGNATTNPVDVDFPIKKLVKYVSRGIESEYPINALLSKFALSEIHLNSLMRRYRSASLDSSKEDPTFDAACAWVRENYVTWTKWLDRLPLCDFETHVQYQVDGCDDEATVDSYRTITFEWNSPNPDNTSEAYNCDGGLRQLPAQMLTSRTCSWIVNERDTWYKWIETQPRCDSSFYKYNITSCNTNAKRLVQYWWLLPSPEDPSVSLECKGGEALPDSLFIECDYMPTDSPVYLGVLVVDGILICLLVMAIGFIIRYRDRPIIKRSQWEFLVVVVVGGILICIAALLYAGEPTTFLCGARPVFTAMGFTTIFGALFVKSLRVYRVFMKTTLKKATVSAMLMFKVFMTLVIVDVLILAAWFIVDFPKPTVVSERAKEFRGVVDHVFCHQGILYDELLISWKTIVLFMGLYSSFLIRNVSSDFQESIWMFASTVVVVIGCLVVLPLVFFIEMPPALLYVFVAGSLLVCTAIVMALMVLPKVHRLHAESSSTSSRATTVSATSTRGLVPKSAISGSSTRGIASRYVAPSTAKKPRS